MALLKITGLMSTVKGKRCGEVVEVDDSQAAALVRDGVGIILATEEAAKAAPVEPVEPIEAAQPVEAAQPAPAKRGRKAKG
jgi:hypothetical protein